MGHDCSHGAFSDHKIINETVGFVRIPFLVFSFFLFHLSVSHILTALADSTHLRRDTILFLEVRTYAAPRIPCLNGT